MLNEDRPPLIDYTASAWRVAFAEGFLDGDSDRPPVARGGSYRMGWKAGKVFRRLRGGGQ